MEFQPILSIIFLQQFRHSQHKQQMHQCLLRQQLIKSKIEYFINNTTVINSVQQYYFLHAVYTVRDQHGHNMNLDSMKTSLVFKFMSVLKNLKATIPRESGKNKHDHKLTELYAHADPVLFKRGPS